jgi:hypothetical protein
MRSRLALLAVAALAALALSACQRDPSIAATVGSDKITEDQVDAILADAQLNRPAPTTPAPAPGNPSPSPAPLGPVQIDRADVVRYLVLDKMCTADQERRHFPSGQGADASEIAQLKAISPNSQYAKVFAHVTACLNGELTGTQPVTPTDAEAREIYDRAKANGLQVAAYDKIKDQIKADDTIKQSIAVKRSLEDQARAQNIVLNPRYRPVEVGLYPIDQSQPIPFEGPQLIVATLGQSSDAIQPF